MTPTPCAAATRGLAYCIAPFLLLPLSACAEQAAVQAAQQDDHHHGSHQWTAFQDGLGLFIDFAPPAQGVKARFLSHFTDLESGAPIEAATVTLEAMSDGQVKEVLTQEIGEVAGFAAVEGFLGAGEREVFVSLSGSAAARFGPFSLNVHADAAAAEEEAHALAHDDGGESISFSVEQQWTARMLAGPVARRDLAQRVAVAGEFETPPHAQAVLSAPFSGRLLAAPATELPRLGDRVEQGALLAVVEVPLSTGDLAALRANSFAWHEHEHELLLREFDLDAQELAAKQDAELARTEIQFAQTRLERVEGLFQRELVTAAEFEAAQQSLAEAELHRVSAEQLLQTLGEIRQGLAELRAEHASDVRGVEAMQVELRAPITGVIERSFPALGSRVEAGQELARIVNPNELWLSLHVAESLTAQAASAVDAKVQLSAHPGQFFELNADLGGELVYRAAQLDTQSRTLKMSYALDTASGIARSLWAGMFADVLLATNPVEQVLAIPSAAVVKQDGLSVAFVQLAGETFEKRVLELGVRDGDWVEVKRGLDEGERVVMRGAYLVRLAASAPDSFGHGHLH